VAAHQCKPISGKHHTQTHTDTHLQAAVNSNRVASDGGQHAWLDTNANQFQANTTHKHTQTHTCKLLSIRTVRPVRGGSTQGCTPKQTIPGTHHTYTHLQAAVNSNRKASDGGQHTRLHAKANQFQAHTTHKHTQTHTCKLLSIRTVRPVMGGSTRGCTPKRTNFRHTPHTNTHRHTPASCCQFEL